MEKNMSLFNRIYEWLMGEPPIQNPPLKVVKKKKKTKKKIKRKIDAR